MPTTDTKVGPSLGDRLLNIPQYLWPQRLCTRLVYRLTRIRQPWFKNAFIRGFCALFKVDRHEAETIDLTAYPHFNAFFTRALRPDARPLSPEGWCCPVDGRVSQVGMLTGDRILQAKGHDYSLTELLGGDDKRAVELHDGAFVTLYLSPRDYHRIHIPVEGQLQSMRHIPGRLFSVSPLTTRVIPGLFARNERLVCHFTTERGPLVVVLVGAINVASIETVWAGVITPPLGTQIRDWDYHSAPITLNRGAELGRFNMGSTVIVLSGPKTLAWHPAIQPEAPVRMGQTLATWLD